MKKTILLPLLLLISQAKAETRITATLTGTIKVEIMTQDHFRHSLECYPLGKGSKTHNLPPQTLALQGATQDGTNSTLKWHSSLEKPFQRNIRA